jgi:hypothetical protein
MHDLYFVHYYNDHTHTQHMVYLAGQSTCEINLLLPLLPLHLLKDPFTYVMVPLIDSYRLFSEPYGAGLNLIMHNFTLGAGSLIDSYRLSQLSENHYY